MRFGWPPLQERGECSIPAEGRSDLDGIRIEVEQPPDDGDRGRHVGQPGKFQANRQ